jgi:outer membrane protein OmpA-like peptidoglycan-associated protein
MQRQRIEAINVDSVSSSHVASSFTDLMASLMVIFILLFIATISNAVVGGAKPETTVEALLGALRAALEAGGMETGGIQKDVRDPSAVVIIMPEALLFRRGESNVGTPGQQFLARMVPRLSEVACRGGLKEKVSSVVVEGHTDSVWTAAILGGADGPQMNLELSQKRSMDVVRWSLEALLPGPERDCFRRLLSASGRGQEEPLPEIAADDSRQRRVVFKIRTQQNSAPDLAKEFLGVVQVHRGER